MYIAKGKKNRSVKANTRGYRRPIKADDEVEVVETPVETEVAPEATDLLFETEDVADLLAEVTGECRC